MQTFTLLFLFEFCRLVRTQCDEQPGYVTDWNGLCYNIYRWNRSDPTESGHKVCDGTKGLLNPDRWLDIDAKRFIAAVYTQKVYDNEFVYDPLAPYIITNVDQAFKSGCHFLNYIDLSVNIGDDEHECPKKIIYYTCYIPSKDTLVHCGIHQLGSGCSGFNYGGGSSLRCGQAFRFTQRENCTLTPHLSSTELNYAPCSPCDAASCPASVPLSHCDCVRQEEVAPKIVYANSAECAPTLIIDKNNCSETCKEYSENDVADLCRYTVWNPWSECSTHCGTGQKKRTRTLKPEKGDNCKSPVESETVECWDYSNCSDCQIFYEWSSDWSQCSASCGFNATTKRKIVQVVNGVNNERCTEMVYDQTTKEEIRQCPMTPCDENCVMSDWLDWTQCNVKCGINGTKSRNRTVLVEAYGNGTRCPNDNIETENCSGEFRECPRSCEYTTWQQWFGCPSCLPVDGLQRYRTRIRDIRREASTYGEKCSKSALSETANCTNKNCPQVGDSGLETGDASRVATFGIVVTAVILIVIVGTTVVLMRLYRRRKQKIRRSSVKKYKHRRQKGGGKKCRLEGKSQNFESVPSKPQNDKGDGRRSPRYNSPSTSSKTKIVIFNKKTIVLSNNKNRGATLDSPSTYEK